MVSHANVQIVVPVRISRLKAAWCAAALAIGALLPHARAQVAVNVTAGYPTIRQGHVMRYGMWTPVIVDVDLNGLPSFDGWLRLAVKDTDGDEVYDRHEVHLRQESGGYQRYFMYNAPNPQAFQNQYAVEMLDEEGNVVPVVSNGTLGLFARPAVEPQMRDHDSRLIVSISNSGVGREAQLVALENEIPFRRNLMVGHISPAQVPDLWLGLTPVDIIIWEQAEAGDLTEQQMTALETWVRHGGTMLVTASRTASQLAMLDSFSRLLPVDFGDVKVEEQLPTLRKEWLQSADDDKTFPRPIPVVECRPKEDARSLVDGEGIESGLVSERQLGRGRVIFSGVTLRDLFSGRTGNAVNFFRKLFYLRWGTNDPRDTRSLYPAVINQVAFARSATKYLFLAAVFSLVYLVSATFGAWWLLGRWGWRRHSWSALGITAGAACLVGMSVVKWQQGFGDQVHQLVVVDADAGERSAVGSVYFGVKSGSDKRLDFWLPEDPIGATEPGPNRCSLKPLPAGISLDELTSTFVDPIEYRVFPASAELHDVRLRATLKRLEGRWVGALPGTVTGNITVRPNTAEGANPLDWRITADSYIVNNLGVTLEDCYLLHAVRNIDFARNLERDRGNEIYAYDIGRLVSDNEPVYLAPRCYRLAEGEETDIFKLMEKSQLAEVQRSWQRPLVSLMQMQKSSLADDATLDDSQAALLLVSTIGDYQPSGDGIMQGIYGPWTWSRDRLGELDLREKLQQDAVYLVGFAREPGPVRLFKRDSDSYRMVEPDPARSICMYRIRIPVTVAGNRPDAEVDPNEEAPR